MGSLPNSEPQIAQSAGQILDRQRSRNKILLLILIAGGLLNAAIPSLFLLTITDSPQVGYTSFGILVFFTLCAVVFATDPATGMHNRPAQTVEEQRFVDAATGLAGRLSLAAPNVAICEDDSANAFTYSPAGAPTLAFTSGLVAALHGQPDLIEAAVAHEFAHFASGDINLSVISARLMRGIELALHVAIETAGAVWAGAKGAFAHSGEDWIVSLVSKLLGAFLALVAGGIFLLGIGWFFALRIVLVLMGRQHQWAADSAAVRLTGKPEAFEALLTGLSGLPTELADGRQSIQDRCLVGTDGGWWSRLWQTQPTPDSRILRIGPAGQKSVQNGMIMPSVTLGALVVLLLISGTVMITWRPATYEPYLQNQQDTIANPPATTGDQYIAPTPVVEVSSAAPPARLPSVTTRPTLAKGSLGTSAYTDPVYHATITAVKTTDFELTVELDARGQSDLRDPATSCIHVSGPAGDFQLSPFGSAMTTADSDHYAGSLRFPVLVPGDYTFVYSCQDDYSTVPIGHVTLPLLGVSTYSSSYFAAVLASQSTTDSLTVWFGSTGPTDLRSPDQTCLKLGDQSAMATVALTMDEHQGPAAFYLGAMTFTGIKSGSFLYSCQDDYSAVDIQ